MKLKLGRSVPVSVALIAVPTALALAVASTASAAPVFEQTSRVNLATGGAQADAVSYEPKISADGRYVAYQSSATNLVAGDTNGTADIFLTDTTTGITTRVSTATGGIQANGISVDAAISADGRYVAYDSSAPDLVAGDTNGMPDIFVTDTTTGTTTRINLAIGGLETDAESYSPAISPDGRYVAYQSNATNLVVGDTNANSDIFLTDTTTGTTTRVSTATGGTQANGYSYDAAISADGRHITYYSAATDLVAGDTNAFADVFVTDTTTGTTTRVSTATDGTQADSYSSYSAISADGRYITYYSEATNLVAGDTNGFGDVFLTDTATGTTTRISTAPGGAQATGHSYNPSISADGRFITFYSAAPNIVVGDTNNFTDVFVTDLSDGITIRVSVATDGTQADGGSVSTVISADGRSVAYYSAAANLVAGDTNALFDIFVTRLGPAAAAPGGPGSGGALADSGSDAEGVMAIAATLTTAGLLAVLWARRRPQTALGGHGRR